LTRLDDKKWSLPYTDCVFCCYQLALLEDFHELRDKVEKCGLYRTSPAFYVAIIAHILFFDALGWWTMKTFGTGWLSYIVASVFLATAQVCSMRVTLLLA